MKNNLIVIWSFLLLTGLASCSDDDIIKEEGTGNLKVKLDDLTVTTNTKTGEDFSHYLVQIIDDEENEIYNGVYSELPSYFELAAAHYTVSANSNDLQEAAFEAPYFHGCEECDIVADETTNVVLNCTLANVLVSVSYSDYVKTLHSITTTVSNGNGSLEYIVTEERTGYFKETESLEVTVSMVRAEGDDPVVKTVSILNVEAAQHHMLNINATDPNTPGTGVFGISIDDSVTEITNNIFLDDDNGGTPTPTPEEPLFINGDFETYDVDYIFPAEATDDHPIYGYGAKVLEGGNTGKAAELGAVDDKACKIGQVVALSAGTYNLSFYTKVVDHDDTQTQNPRVVIKTATTDGLVGIISDAEGVVNGEKYVIPISETFTQSTIELVVPESVNGTTNIVFWVSPKPGTVLFDDIQLTATE